MLAYLAVFGGSLCLSLVLTPVSIRLAKRLGIVAKPGGRRQHQGLVPKLGGLVILGAFFGGALLSLAVRSWLPPPPEGPDDKEMGRFVAVLAGAALIGAFGLVDDRRELGSKPQYLAQAVVTVIAIAGQVFIERVGNPFTGGITVFPWWMVGALTFLWLMGMMNTVNFLDGLDGLAAGVGGIVSIVLLVHMLRVGHYGPALLPAALLGTLLGFLPFNLFPSKIHLGSGAVTLGYLIGTLSLVAGARVATVTLVMGIPIVDVAWQILNRWRHGRSMNEGDRGHLHYRLQDLGLPQSKVVLGYWLFCALLSALTFVVSSRLYKAIAIVVLGALVMLVLALLSRRAEQRGRETGPSDEYLETGPSDEYLETGPSDNKTRSMQ
jgi:UDP-GlcNAc:undecaprenyl-phosphate GlcNAc-1-phosphate transferase